MNLGRSEIASVLLAAVAVASGVLVFATREAPTTAERSERDQHLLALWRKPEITRFSLERGRERAEVERRGDGFALTAPVAEDADDAAVDRLLDGLGSATRLRGVDVPDGKQLGFEAPRARVLLTMGSERYTISLGAAAPSPAGAAYVEVRDASGSRVASVVSREIASLLLLPLDELRRRALVELSVREIAELQVERPFDTIRLVRGSGVSFRLDGKELADRDRSEPLFRVATTLSATRFVDLAAAEKAMLGTKPLRVRLVPRDSRKKPAEIAVGGACPSEPGETLALVRLPTPRAACVANETAPLLLVERAALVSTTPFSARKDEVESVSIERGERKLAMTRQGNGFLLRKPSEATVELETGNQRLEALLRAPAEIVKAPVPKELGLEPPEGKVVLTVLGDDDKAAEEIVELGRVNPDGTLHVRRKEDGVVLAIGRDGARAFQIDTTLLRSRKVLDFALSALAELELSGPEPQLLRRSPLGFELVTPPKLGHDGELATNAVLALGSLTATRFVAEEDDGSFGFEKPTLTAKIRLDPGDAGVSEKTLVVGRSTSGGAFAKLEGTPGVFVIERGVVERLSVLLVDRGKFLADANGLARLTLSTPAKTLEFVRRAGSLASAGGDVDATALAQALEALSTLRAEAAVHTGPARESEGFAEPVLRVRLEPTQGSGNPRTFSIGKSDEYRGQPVRFARADGVAATFVVAEAKLRPLLELF